ncbi:TraR/DksA family transcriptional regulator [Roseateles sp. P5_E11]
METQTQAHLPMLRQLLLYRQTELRAEVHAAQLARQAVQTQSQEVRDLKDDAELMQRQQTEDFQAARDLRELQDVDDALGRLAAGGYGDCANCGEAIPVARLTALPSVRLCAGCQAVREHLS